MEDELLKSPRFRWAVCAAWASLIFLLSAQSRLPSFVPLGMGNLQALGGHLVEYAVLALLLYWALRGVGVRHAAWLAFGAAVLYGISDEFHQGFVPGRHRDFSDLMVDAAAAGGALLVAVWLIRRRGSRSQVPRR